jgi:hypothetical protein
LTEKQKQGIEHSISKGVATRSGIIVRIDVGRVYGWIRYSRVDIVQSAEVFKHPVTETHIVTRLTAEKTTLLFFQS